jgi:hypothetical protein
MIFVPRLGFSSSRNTMEHSSKSSNNKKQDGGHHGRNIGQYSRNESSNGDNSAFMLDRNTIFDSRLGFSGSRNPVEQTSKSCNNNKQDGGQYVRDIGQYSRNEFSNGDNSACMLYRNTIFDLRLWFSGSRNPIEQTSK